jgi:arylsulfatase A-like enzyme
VPTSDTQNVLLLHTDQQRYSALGCAGNDAIQTPNLDRLAADGVRFSRAFVQAPVCMPSRASYMTGRYPTELGIFDNGSPLPEDVRTLPEYLGGRGYETANVGKLHFLPHAARDHTQPHPSYGFDHLEISDEPGCYPDAYRSWVADQDPDALDDVSVGLPPVAKDRQSDSVRTDIEHPEYRFPKEPVPFGADDDLTHTAFVARRTMDYLRQHRDDRFLCVSGFYSPHSPWVVPQRFLDMYDPEDMPIPDLPDDLAERRAELSADSPEDPTFSEEERRGAYRGYFAMVSEVDHWVGRILDTLSELGIRDETLVVFTSDHGEDLGDHCSYGKGFPARDNVSRVPLIAAGPSVDGGRVVDDLVELVDLVPTLIDAAGGPVPSDLQGQSLAPALAGDGCPERDAALTESGDGKVLRTDRYRYVVGAEGEERLYDVAEDPMEYEDVSGDPAYDEALGTCRRRLLQRLSAIDARRHRDQPVAY